MSKDVVRDLKEAATAFDALRQHFPRNTARATILALIFQFSDQEKPTLTAKLEKRPLKEKAKAKARKQTKAPHFEEVLTFLRARHANDAFTTRDIAQELKVGGQSLGQVIYALTKKGYLRKAGVAKYKGHTKPTFRLNERARISKNGVSITKDAVSAAN